MFQGVNMTTWRDKLLGDPIPWLLESDPEQPAIRYFTLRDILGYAEESSEVRQASRSVSLTGPVPKILAAQQAEGYWFKPGPGYSPKYQSTVWQIIFLSQLGADSSDSRVRAGCEYILSHTLSKNGWFSYNGAPSSFVHCLAGNLEAALIDLGYVEDARLQSAIEKHAKFTTGKGMTSVQSKDTAERFYSYTPGPLFKCGPNAGLSCGWGAVKSMNAFSKVPAAKRTQNLNKAIQQGVDFLLSRDPTKADYPTRLGDKPSSTWFKFGYPLGYTTDVLQNLEVLVALGQASDPRLVKALEFVQRKQDHQGRWKMEYSLNGKMWADIEKKGLPSKWVSLRALRVLKATYPESNH
jgi:hypothetical protein